MRVEMKTIYAGPRGVANPGEVIDLADREAYALIEGGYAVQVGAPAALDTAAPAEISVVEAPEAAVAPRQRARRRAS